MSSQRPRALSWARLGALGTFLRRRNLAERKFGGYGLYRIWFWRIYYRTRWRDTSRRKLICSAESATEAISLALDSLSHALKAMCHTFLACLSRAAGSAIEAISLALHSRPSVWHIALRRCETHSQCVSLAPPRAPLKLSLLHSIVFHMPLSMVLHKTLLLRRCVTRS